MTGQEAPLRVLDMPVLGVETLQVGRITLGAAATAERTQQIGATVAPIRHAPALRPDPALLAILEEVRGLRQDLADRTFAGRCRRFWAWMKGLWP